MKAIMRDEREMKDSGIEWIGKIPIHWSYKKIKHIASLYTGNSISDSDKDNYSDPIDAHPYIATKHINADNNSVDYENGLYVKDSDIGFKVATPNSTLMCIEGGSAGRKKAFIRQTVSFVNKLCCFKAKGTTLDKYIYYFLMSPNYEEKFKTLITGLIGGVSVSELKNIPSLAPPHDEQQLIANYLDDRCSKIDTIIAEAKASIEEYKELKQAVIYEAVTKGLDKNVEMKDSGIEWIGKTPLDWQIIRVKHLLTEVNNRSVQGLEEPLSVSQVLGIVPSSEISVANPTSSYIGQKVVEQHDMVFNRLKAHLGVFFESNYKGLVSPDYAVFRGNKRINPKFLEYLFHTPAAITEFKKYITGVGDGLRRLYTDDLFNISVSIPSIEIQNEIISTLNLKVQKIDVLVSEKQSLIEDLESYKKSLIYEVVTGKRKVVA